MITLNLLTRENNSNPLDRKGDKGFFNLPCVCYHRSLITWLSTLLQYTIDQKGDVGAGVYVHSKIPSVCRETGKGRGEGTRASK